jgi:tricorn protease-like protein
MESPETNTAKKRSRGCDVVPPPDSRSGHVLGAAMRLLVGTSGRGLGCELTVIQTEPRPRRRRHAILVVCVFVVFLTTACGQSSQLRWSDDEPSWSHGGRRVVFVSNRPNPDGDFSVYVTKAAGGGLRRLTNDGGSDESPSFSPDGRRIAYVRTTLVYGTNGDINEYCYGELDVIRSDGGGESYLATVNGGGHGFIPAPAWSPDGHLIAFVRTSTDFNSCDFTGSRDRGDLWVVPADGGRERRVAKGVGSFAWSHDGRRIAFGCAAGDLCLVSARGGAVHRLTHMRAGTATTFVDWSSDDRQLAFVHGSGGSYQPDYSAWVINADGTGAHRLPRFGEGNVDTLLWLPRQAETLLVATDDGRSYLVRRDGTHQHDLLINGQSATPSPDGTKLLVVQAVDRGYPNQYYSAIYLTNIDGGSERQLTQTHQ